MDRPELPPGYVIEVVDHERPYHVRLHDELVEELVDREGGSYWEAREEAVEACWGHWRVHGDPAWVEYFERTDERQLQAGATRVPFDGYLDLTPEQRGSCQALIDACGKVIKKATGAAPTVDTVVLASHLAQFADAALAEDGFAPSKQAVKLSQALFGGATTTSEICSLLLSQLVMRLYSAPYGGLNEAGLDFVNTLLVVLSTALPAPRKLKHPGG